MKLKAACIALALVAAPAAFADDWKDESGKGREEKREVKHDKHEDRHRERGAPRGESYFQEHGYTRLDIPPGHYPPPGECRVWYPDRPPGHQPPPVKCRNAAVPPGAWLIRHPADRPDHVHVVVYEPERPRVPLVVGEFEIGSGVFVKVVAP